MDDEGAFVPHKPDSALWGTTIVYRCGWITSADQKRLIEANPRENKNPQANKKASVFYVAQTTLEAWQRYENHRNGPLGEQVGRELRRLSNDAGTRSIEFSMILAGAAPDSFSVSRP